MEGNSNQVPESPSTPTARKRNKLCPENDKLVHEWINDFLKRQAKPSLLERREILKKVQKLDYWYQMTNLNNSFNYYKLRLQPHEKQENMTEPLDTSNSSPSQFIVDGTKLVITLLRERPDASDEHIKTWALSLGIEEEAVKEHVKKLRGENGNATWSESSIGAGKVGSLAIIQPSQAMDMSNDTVNPPHTASCEPDSPQSEVPTVVPQHRDAPAQMSARNMHIGLEGFSSQFDGFLSPAISATDAVDLAMLDSFVLPEPIHDFTPDSKVPHLSSFTKSSGMQEDADTPTTADKFHSKFKPFRDKMDSLILRIRSARRAQTHQNITALSLNASRTTILQDHS